MENINWSENRAYILSVHHLCSDVTKQCLHLLPQQVTTSRWGNPRVGESVKGDRVSFPEPYCVSQTSRNVVPKNCVSSEKRGLSADTIINVDASTLSELDVKPRLPLRLQIVAVSTSVVEISELATDILFWVRRRISGFCCYSGATNLWKQCDSWEDTSSYKKNETDEGSAELFCTTFAPNYTLPLIAVSTPSSALFKCWRLLIGRHSERRVVHLPFTFICWKHGTKYLFT
jgi:hypothetical protein